MKKLIVLSLILFSISLYPQVVQGQTTGTNVNVLKERELQPESSVINVPLTTDLTKYKNIVLSVLGFACYENENDIRNALQQSIFNVDKKDFKKGKTKMEENTIYFFWNRTEDGVDRSTTIILRDYNMKVLYSASHTNVGRAKMLDFILNQ